MHGVDRRGGVAGVLQCRGEYDVIVAAAVQPDDDVSSALWLGHLSLTSTAQWRVRVAVG